ncbi:(Glutamate--ammonia-ligase) adenylyltransferase [Thermovibrio ammonificans HB-1]|uniref:(Glutamate--ammonia-ligase) adenylyltransferase n=1 Tax=Thermovibrio ammonificans (strain DSM 15698 / JCM 12110 / HB-1) TaxID=648996 RepID=E8T5A1_THEA1|nr:[glutamate--ammonia-ligase] adenylyltransferase [Thermovibrio ammonificans]ADU96439.1 (Glutamate--ammonia-ligase) adenylyltransferase [Thermovibrio ammonificans HB-1]
MKLLVEKLKSSLPQEWHPLVEFVEREKLPNPRRALILLEKLYRKVNALPEPMRGEFGSHVVRLFSYSQFLGEFLVRHPELLPELERVYGKTLSPADFRPPVEGERSSFMKGLRVFKHFHMCRVLLRDILGLAPFSELVRDVTLIHKGVTAAALEFASREFERRYGKPSSTFLVVGMGKAAGFELNYSSDLDLIFVYGSRYGETAGGSYGKLQNHDYFTLLAKEVVELLSANTPEGICCVVDTRLRPNGTMGPLVNDLQALEQYYTAVARPWERFALLKAQPFAGDCDGLGVEFLKLTRAFVFRKYVDLTLIEEVLRLKELIKAKVQKKGAKIDLKLGKGGIREVEFIVQAFQLIYGGKFPQIRSRNTLVALKRLFKWGFLDRRSYTDLRQAYLFLRRAEHMLQVTHFRQTQTFHPESEEAAELALKMGFDSREAFLAALREVMERVNGYFNRFFPTGENRPLSTITEEDLRRMGFAEPAEVKRFIEVLLSSKKLSPEELNRLDVMGERFLELLLEAPSSKNAMKNLVALFDREEGKLFFFSILNQVNALRLLLFLLSTKDFFISRFRATPELVDFIFRPELIEEPVTSEVIERYYGLLGNLQLVKNLFEVVALLRYRLARTKVEEFFEEFTTVCDFALSRIYREVSPPFTVSSLGKHGSREMTVGSDLDLLFVSSAPPGEEGARSAVELIKRLEGLGYEVDTRLRPFGEKGELVFTLNYFRKYLKENARLWERLAFTRFRPFAGSISSEVEEAVREFIFSEPLNLETLEGIVQMRERLERELGRKEPLKYGRGGTVDLDFISYTYQLYSGKWLRNTLKALRTLAEQEPRFERLVELYRRLRQAETEKRLFGELVTYGDRIADLREEVRTFYLEFTEWMRERLS